LSDCFVLTSASIQIKPGAKAGRAGAKNLQVDENPAVRAAGQGPGGRKTPGEKFPKYQEFLKYQETNMPGTTFKEKICRNTC